MACISSAAGLAAPAAAARAPHHSVSAGAAHRVRAHENRSCHSSATRPAPSHCALALRRTRARRHSAAPVSRVKPGPTPAESRAAARAASIASALEAACQNTEVAPEPSNLPLVRAAVLCLVNRVRAQHGEPPLVPNAKLEQAAEEHNQEMIAEDYFAHVSPAGKTPVDRIRATGYIPSPADGYVIGENLAWGTLSLSTAQAIVAAWVASPGHLANILEAQYQDTGIAIVPTVPSSLSGGQPGATYAQEFGVVIS